MADGTPKRSSRRLVGALALLLVPVWLVWARIAFALHGIGVGGVCLDTDCYPAKPDEALAHDLVAGAGLGALLLVILFGFAFAMSGRLLRACGWAGLAAGLGLAAWIVILSA